MLNYQNILSITALSLALSACGGNDASSTKDGGSSNVDQSQDVVNDNEVANQSQIAVSNNSTENQSGNDNSNNPEVKVLHKASGHYVSAGNDGVLRVWSEDQQTVLEEIGVSSLALSSLVISPDSKKLIVGDQNGVIHYYLMDSGTILRESYKEFSVIESGKVQELSFDQLSYNFFSITSDGQRRVWDHHVSIPIKEAANVKEVNELPSVTPPPSPM